MKYSILVIPHHEGAVAMAQIALANGKDSEVRKLAGKVIAAREKEITQMCVWPTKHGRTGGNPMVEN